MGASGEVVIWSRDEVEAKYQELYPNNNLWDDWVYPREPQTDWEPRVAFYTTPGGERLIMDYECTGRELYASSQYNFKHDELVPMPTYGEAVSFVTRNIEVVRDRERSAKGDWSEWVWASQLRVLTVLAACKSTDVEVWT